MKTKTKEKKQEEDRGESQAKAQLESIREMVEAYREAESSSDEQKMDEARQRINEDPLSVEVRSDWHSPGENENKPDQFRVLLCWGGPSCQLIGELDQYGQPDEVELQYQDWFTKWAVYPTTSEDDEILLEYCRQFYFGE